VHGKGVAWCCGRIGSRREQQVESQDSRGERGDVATSGNSPSDEGYLIFAAAPTASSKSKCQIQNSTGNLHLPVLPTPRSGGSNGDPATGFKSKAALES
jgi:hypothetical protein